MEDWLNSIANALEIHLSCINLMLERCNSIANALELRLSCINPSSMELRLSCINPSRYAPDSTMGLFNGLMQERRNSIANALELHLSCINPSRCAAVSYTGLSSRWAGQWSFGAYLPCCRAVVFWLHLMPGQPIGNALQQAARHFHFHTANLSDPRPATNQYTRYWPGAWVTR